MTTTIKVSDDLRDRLKAQASRYGSTLGAHLARLADAEDRRWRLATLRTAISATSPVDAEAYAHEDAQWERSELSDTP